MSESARIKVVVNKNACCAYGLCAEICPEVYKLDANGIAYVEEELVPEGLEELAREGAAATGHCGGRSHRLIQDLRAA